MISRKALEMKGKQLSHSDNVTKAEAKMVRKMVDLCLRELARAEHEIPATYGHMKLVCDVHVKYRGQASYGGARGVSIDIGMLRTGKSFMWEYALIAKDPVIGEMECGDAETHLFGLVAHEVAHHVQSYWGPRTRWLKAKYRKAHGEGWRDLYRILRSRLVNPRATAIQEVA